MMSVHAPTAAPVRDEQVAELERAFALPTVEPHRPVGDAPATRRAATVVRAVRAGYTPLELAAAAMFWILALACPVLVVLGIAA